MNKTLKEFLHRGMMYAGFGPIIAGIVYMSLDKAITNFTLTGAQVFVAIVSTYLLAFIQAGASVFNQIESWSIPKSSLCHFSLIYIAYVGCYLVNDWIPFDMSFLLIFTAIFALVYLAIWISVYISIKLVSRKLNTKLC